MVCSVSGIPGVKPKRIKDEILCMDIINGACFFWL